MILLLFCIIAINVQFSASYPKISVYGDIYTDTEFFVRTFPWIIDNIGAQIEVHFYMQGSGRYTVPQMCALDQLRDNTFLQAQYLKCEAQDQSSEVCLCESGIDPQRFRECVLSGSTMASDSAISFQKLGIDVTPIIELGPQSTVFGVEDSWFLKKICTIFGDDLPRGCTKPFACNGTEIVKRGKALAQFDKCCANMQCGRPDDIVTTTPVPTTVPTTVSWSTALYPKKSHYETDIDSDTPYY